MIRAEFYITQVVLWNTALRCNIARMLGLPASHDAQSVLAELRGSQALKEASRRLDCTPDSVFDVLRRRIVATPQATRAASKDLPIIEALRSERFVSSAAITLSTRGSRESAYEAFFDRELLLELLERPRDDPSSMESIVERLLQPDGIRAVLREYQAIDFAAIVPLLMTEPARKAMSAALECKPAEIGLHLRRLSDTSNEGQHGAAVAPINYPPDGTPELDLFGVEKVREMLRPVERFMLREAHVAAKEVRSSTVAPQAAQYAVALVEFWGNGAYRKALQELPLPQTTIGRLASQVLERASVPYTSDVALTLADGATPERLGVEYQPTAGQKRPLAELIVQDANAKETIRRFFPCASHQLTGTGDTLLSRLLTSQVLIASELSRKTWSRCLEGDSAFSDFLVSSGLAIPDEFGVAKAFDGGSSHDRPTLQKTRLRCPSTAQLLARVRAQLRAT